MKVKANKTGFYGGLLRGPGDVFDIDDRNQLGTWMIALKKKPGRKPRAESGDGHDQGLGDSHEQVGALDADK